MYFRRRIWAIAQDVNEETHQRLRRHCNFEAHAQVALDGKAGRIFSRVCVVALKKNSTKSREELDAGRMSSRTVRERPRSQSIAVGCRGRERAVKTERNYGRRSSRQRQGQLPDGGQVKSKNTLNVSHLIQTWQMKEKDVPSSLLCAWSSPAVRFGPRAGAQTAKNSRLTVISFFPLSCSF